MTHGSGLKGLRRRRDERLDGRRAASDGPHGSSNSRGGLDPVIAILPGFGARVVLSAMSDDDQSERQPDTLRSEYTPSRVHPVSTHAESGRRHHTTAARELLARGALSLVDRSQVDCIRLDDETAARADA